MAGRTSLFALAALAAAALPGPAMAQSWGTPEREFARYGIRTIVCDTRTHDAPCLGLACIDGALALVNVAGGGGPMDGRTRVSTGRETFTLDFTWDDKAVDRLGVAASSADLTIQHYEALLRASAITLTAGSDSSFRHRFPTRGLAAEWERAARSCR